MNQKSEIHRTRRHLTTIFTGGAMLFLIIFEAVFMISRIILEDSVEEGKFQEETDHIIQMLDRREQGA